MRSDLSDSTFVANNEHQSPMINKEESCAKKLLLDNVPPPPKSQPPKIEELTSALEKQLTEIEKHVVEKRKQSEASTKPVFAINSQQVQHQPSQAQQTSNKFGNSMREMLKNVVSSQKTNTDSKKQGKVGKFFQNLSIKNALSKSNQNLDQQVQVQDLKEDFKTSQTSLTSIQSESKRRSKSLSSETRNTSKTNNRSEIGTSNSVVGNKTRAEGHATTKARWLGKNPFDTSPATEVFTHSTTNPFEMDDELKGHISGLSQDPRSMVRTRSSSSQRCSQETRSALGESASDKVIHRKSINSLIQECEDYVKTEEFTKDLSSQILKMFMQERQSALVSTHVDARDDMKNVRDSLYDNDFLVKEESPDSNDSAYDSDKKDFQPLKLNSKSSSLMMMDMDSVSNASTIKNQLFARDEESISYDTVLR